MQWHEINVKVHFGNISIGWEFADSCLKTFYTFKYNSTKKLNTDALLNAITERICVKKHLLLRNCPVWKTLSKKKVLHMLYVHVYTILWTQKIFKINQDLLPKQLNVTQCVFNSFEIKLKFWVKHKTKHVCFFHGVNSGSMSI